MEAEQRRAHEPDTHPGRWAALLAGGWRSAVFARTISGGHQRRGPLGDDRPRAGPEPDARGQAVAGVLRQKLRDHHNVPDTGRSLNRVGARTRQELRATQKPGRVVHTKPAHRFANHRARLKSRGAA